jgi:hypothetical protein
VYRGAGGFFDVGDYRALMITDTAPFRYRQYHTSQDTPDRLDYLRMAKVYRGILAVITDLAE